MGDKCTAVIAHSGGPTAVINGSLLGAIEEARLHGEISRFYGARFGIGGILEQTFVDLLQQPPDLLNRVCRTPGSALGSSRHEVTEKDFARVLQIFQNHGVRYFFYTGGNGSMGTALQLERAAEVAGLPLQVIGIPKTIDNDLLATDHTPGYISTATFFAHAVRDIGADNRSLPNQVEVIEVLGRNVGWVAAATSLAKSDPDDAPHLIYLPERRLPLEKLLEDVQTVFQRLKRCVVVVCEGQLDEHGEPFGADVRSGSRGSLAQNLGHRLSLLITEKLKVRARSEKPGLLGRCTSAYLSELDWEEARLCGRHAVQLAAAGKSGVMVNLQRNPGAAYAITPGSVSLAEVAFAERSFPNDWVTPDGTAVTASYREYAAPIIQPLESYAQLDEIV